MLLDSTNTATQYKLNRAIAISERHFLEQREQIRTWFQAQWQLTRPPVYGSVDLRNAGI